MDARLVKGARCPDQTVLDVVQAALLPEQENELPFPR
jgi:hypothetical protein